MERLEFSMNVTCHDAHAIGAAHMAMLAELTEHATRGATSFHTIRDASGKAVGSSVLTIRSLTEADL